MNYKAKAYLARYRKGVMAITGALAQAVALGLLHGNALVAAELVLAAATAAGVVSVPNEPVEA